MNGLDTRKLHATATPTQLNARQPMQLNTGLDVAKGNPESFYSRAPASVQAFLRARANKKKAELAGTANQPGVAANMFSAQAPAQAGGPQGLPPGAMTQSQYAQKLTSQGVQLPRGASPQDITAAARMQQLRASGGVRSPSQFMQQTGMQGLTGLAGLDPRAMALVYQRRAMA